MNVFWTIGRFFLITTVFSLSGVHSADNPVEKLNRALGIPLFSDRSLLNEAVSETAARLGLQRVSRTRKSETWSRVHVRTGPRELEEIRVFADVSGRVTGVELNLLNKGDFFNPERILERARKRYGEDDEAKKRAEEPSHSLLRDTQKEYRQLQTSWEEALSEAFTECLGEAKHTIMKRGRRERVRRWTWRDCALLLDVRDDEFVMLRIMSVAEADAGGEGEKTSDSDLKERLLSNVVRETNGDVWIRNIPMVDQGDKGYCAVASGERLLRYLGISIDSHELAQLADTDRLGGTSWSGIKNALQVLASRNRRAYRDISGESGVSTVSRYIDRGIPIIWCMYVTEEMEIVARHRIGQRAEVSNRDWKKRLAAERKITRRIEPDRRGCHVRLIVGYNEETGEIAYSDSWGDSRMFWLEEHEAQTVSTGGKCLGAVIP